MPAAYRTKKLNVLSEHPFGLLEADLTLIQAVLNTLP